MNGFYESHAAESTDCGLRMPADHPCDGLPVVEVSGPDGPLGWGCVRHAAATWIATPDTYLSGERRSGAMAAVVRFAFRGRR